MPDPIRDIRTPKKHKHKKRGTKHPTFLDVYIAAWDRIMLWQLRTSIFAFPTSIYEIVCKNKLTYDKINN